jgi:hypothetical protein
MRRTSSHLFAGILVLRFVRVRIFAAAAAKAETESRSRPAIKQNDDTGHDGSHGHQRGEALSVPKSALDAINAQLVHRLIKQKARPVEPGFRSPVGMSFPQSR